MAESPRKRTSTKKVKKGKKNRLRSLFFVLFFTAVFAIVCGIIGYLLIVLNGERLLAENGSKLNLGEASIIYDAQGEEVARLAHADENRELAEFSEIPKVMLDAIVATEDQRFYEHSGLDFWAIGRAVVKDIIARSAVEGGSTITQQLAKNVFLSADKTFFRKATEASIAVALENEMSKEEILTMYLNRIYFGKGVYGVKNAAKYYFGVELQELEVWQAATLAGIPKAPSRFNPVSHPDNSMNRRAVVLKLMYDQGKITQAEMESAKAVVYEQPEGQKSNGNSSDYLAFIDYVVDEAIDMTNLTEEELRVGGYRIYTTLNKKAQSVVEKEFADDDNFEKSVDEQLSQAAMIILDHRDGAIQAMAGGRDYVKKGLNRVNVTRQPGSTIKPITVYGPALESGGMYPWTVLDNDQKCFNNYCPTDRWGPVAVTMQQAIKDSRNLAAVWTLNNIGVKKGMDFAKKLGLELTDDDRNLSIALGGLTKGSTPLEMATAYAIFANGGKSVDPHTIVKIERGNKAIYKYEAPKSEQLMSPTTAWYMTEMLQTVIEKGGTGTRAAIGRPLAGKTGTTQHGIPGYRGGGIRDAWFVGYTPEWTAAVWLGYDRTDEKHLLDKNSSAAATLFAKVMKPAMQGVESGSFKKPGSIKENVAPAAVSNLQAVFEDGIVRLTWDPSPVEGAIYKVYRKEQSESAFSHFVDMQTAGTDDMSAFPGMTYEYYVTVYDPETKLESSPSATLKFEVPETEIDIPELPTETLPPDEGEIDQPGGGDGNNGGIATEPPIDNGEGTGEPDDGTTPPGEIPIPTLPPVEGTGGSENGTPQANGDAGNAGASGAGR